MASTYPVLTKLMATHFDFSGSERLRKETKFVPRGQSMVKNKKRGGG